eukprot:1154457-Pelagomonas_calceolata.AAC.1
MVKNACVNPAGRKACIGCVTRALCPCVDGASFEVAPSVSLNTDCTDVHEGNSRSSSWCSCPACGFLLT